MISGLVVLYGDSIGSFELGDDQKIAITFDKTKNWMDIDEALQFVTEQGTTLGLMLKPTFED